MRILIIRHGDPDLVHDCLTEQGIKEVEALNKYFKNIKVDEAYSSSLNRSFQTARGTLGNDFPLGISDALKEYELFIPTSLGTVQSRDMTIKEIKEHENWLTLDFVKNNPELKSQVEATTSFVDEVLKKNGYSRNGRFYHVLNSNRKTIVFFCHYESANVILSHFLNISFMELAHFAFLRPTGIIELVSEERNKGQALFRLHEYNATPHLLKNGVEKSKWGSFAEIFDCDERH